MHQRRRASIALTGVLGVIVLSRLPLLIDNPFLPDGDESLLALMAREAARTGHVPVFLWGQRYGLAGPEIGLTAVAFRLLGEQAWAMHAAVLALWAFGALFLVDAVRRVESVRAARWTALLLVTSPGWFATSMKAWGTSVTAFLCSAMAIWSAAYLVGGTADTAMPRPSHSAPGEEPAAIPSGGRAAVAAAMLGVATVLAVCANPLWFFCVVPFGAAIAWQRIPLRLVITVVVAGVAAAVALGIVSAGARGYWEPSLFRHPAIWQSLTGLPGHVLTALTGVYAVGRSQPFGWVTRGVAAAWLAASVVALGIGGARIRRRSASRLETGALAAAVLSLLVSLAIEPRYLAFRYLLPAVTALIVLLALAAARVAGRLAVVLAAGVAIAWPLTALEFRRVAPNAVDRRDGGATVAAMDSVLASLRAEGIHDVYSMDSMLPWTLMYVSGGAVTARWLDPEDRNPTFPHAVDCAARRGARIAFIGRLHQLAPESRTPRVRVIGGEYFAIPDPPLASLAGMGFRIGTC